MKILAIREDNGNSVKDLAYLLYYEKAKAFYIEIPEDADEWEVPLILDSFVKRGEHTVNAYWSKRWVEQRIVPTDRQNLGQILKANNLSEYDEFGLLMLSNGRCAQDDYYLAQIAEDAFPPFLLERYQKKVEDVVVLGNQNLLVFFRDGVVRKVDVTSLLVDKSEFKPVLERADLFSQVSVQVGGYGVCWGTELVLSDSILYQSGEIVPLSLEDFKGFVLNRVVNSAEAAEILDCSRQNIEDLVKRGKLTPIKSSSKNKLFLKSEIQQRNWL